jgi:hypothetical protein
MDAVAAEIVRERDWSAIQPAATINPIDVIAIPVQMRR